MQRKQSKRKKTPKRITNGLLISQAFVDLSTKQAFGRTRSDGVDGCIHSGLKATDRSMYKRARGENIT